MLRIDVRSGVRPIIFRPIILLLILQITDMKYGHLGLRNPWRWSFDAFNGQLFIGDVGQDAWEEVDVELKDAGDQIMAGVVMKETILTI